MLNGKDISPPGAEAAAADRRLHADGVPEPVRHAQPEPLGRRPDRARGAEVRRRERPRRRSASACSSCSTWSSCRAPSTTAGRASSRAGRSSGSASPAPSPATQGGDRRRAGLGPRRLGPGGGDPAPDGDPAQEPHHAPVHQPRPVAGALPRRPGRGHVSRQIMEQGTTDEVFSPPYHPYTEALLSAVPIADTRSARSTSCSRARSPRPSICRPAARSRPAATARSAGSARPRRRRCGVRQRPPDPLPPAARGAAGDGAGDRARRQGGRRLTRSPRRSCSAPARQANARSGRRLVADEGQQTAADQGGDPDREGGGAGGAQARA